MRHIEHYHFVTTGTKNAGGFIEFKKVLGTFVPHAGLDTKSARTLYADIVMCKACKFGQSKLMCKQHKEEAGDGTW